MTHWDSVESLVQAVHSGSESAVGLVQRSLDAIKQAEEFNSIITINESALEQAKKIDEALAGGKEVGPLAGIPYIAKDNFLTKDVETTAASHILKGFIPPINASAIDKLEEAGAVMVAKANLDSFAHGSSTENSDYGPTKNPHDATRVPGGSSGGSAAAVVLNLAPFALGTDTGGSIRLPASFTGSVGLKPTYGLVSRYGVVAMASSTDVIGPITRSVDDAAYVLEVIAGRDELDSSTIERDPDNYTDLAEAGVSLQGLKIGVVKEHMDEGVEQSTKEAIQLTIEKLRAAGADISEVSIPELAMALAVYYIVMPAEVSSNLSRYDGIRYGYSSESAQSLDDVYLQSRSLGFNNEVKRRILIGTYVLSSGYYDAYYKKAQSVRTVLINKINQALEQFDFLIGPTAPDVAFKLGDNIKDPLQMYLTDIMTVAPNLVGIPAISIPVGTNPMPIGMQIMAPMRADKKLLAFAKQVEDIVEAKS